MRFHLGRLPAFLALGVLLTAASPPSGQADDGGAPIRVRLLEAHHPRILEVRSQGGPLSFFTNDPSSAPVARLEDGEAARIRVQDTGVYLELPEDDTSTQALRIVPLADAHIRLQVTSGADVPPARVYEGTITVEPDPEAPATLQVVNEVGLEAYVAGVLARDFGFDEPEAAKAMAVVIRTYALFVQDQSAGAYDLSDHAGTQVYEGVGEITPAVLEAVEATRGEVLMHRNRPIEAVQFASSGGHTASNEDVWGGPPRPYLRGRPDPYDASPYARWRFTLSRSELLPALSEAYGFAVSGLRLGERSPDGRVATVVMMSAERDPLAVRASDFRQVLNRRFGPTTLKSTLFDLERTGDQFVFEGRGLGHGVGLPHWSAREQARQGRSYTDMLAFYYTDVALGSTDVDLAMPLPDPPAVAGRPAPPAVEPAARESTREEETPHVTRTDEGAVPPRTRFEPSPKRKGW